MNLESQKKHQGEEGSAIFVVLVVMAIVLALMMGNTWRVSDLGRQLRAVDTRQQKYWTSLSAESPTLNAPPK